MTLRRALLATTMLSGIVGSVFFSSTASARDLERPGYLGTPTGPAVDGLNARVEGLFGTMSGKPVQGSRGSLTVPLAGQWGLQVDGALGALDHSAFGSVGGHLFWRNPAVGLVGLYAAHTRWDRFGGVHATQIGGEAEYYWGRFTIQGIAGIEFGNTATSFSSTSSFIPQGAGINPPPNVLTTSSFLQGYDIKTRFFDQVNLGYYITDNWQAYVGHRYLGGKNALALGSEIGLPLGRGIMGTAFVEGRLAEGSFNGVWGGLKFYFGQRDKPLIDRHRQDDPPPWDTLFTILNSGVSGGSTSSSVFCTPPRTLQPNGSCEFGSF